MKKQFLAVFFVLSLMGMASVLQAQTGPDFAYANYMEYGSPMWVSPVEGAAPSPLIEAVQVSVDGYVTQIEPTTGWEVIKDVKKGDVVVRYLEKGQSKTQIIKPDEFLKKYTLADGEKIKLISKVEQKAAPRVDTRMEVRTMMEAVQNGAADGAYDYAKMPKNTLSKFEILSYQNKVLSKQIDFRLAPVDGYMTDVSGKSVQIKAGSLLKYNQAGRITQIIPAEYLKGIRFYYVTSVQGGAKRLYVFNAANQKLPINELPLSSRESLVYDSRTGTITNPKFGGEKFTKMNFPEGTNLGKWLKVYSERGQYAEMSRQFIENVTKGGLPVSTPAILESYMRYQNAMDRISLNFSNRHTSEFAKAALAEDIKIAKEARAKTRELMSKHKAEFKALANKKVYNKNLSPKESVRMKGFFRKVVGGTLVSALVVAGFQGIEMALDRMAEPDNTAQNAAVLRASVQDRDRYINTIKTHPELLVYMPTNLMSEAYMRRDFDQPAMAAELYLFNQFVEETQKPGSVAKELLARVEQEQTQAEASALAEEVLQDAAVLRS